VQPTTKNNNVTTTFEDKNKYDQCDKEFKEHTNLSQNEDNSDNEFDELYDVHDVDMIEVTFHVHMPQNFDESMQPLVIGNVDELGNWKKPKTKLHQIDINSTYWVSDPIKIYQRDYDDVEYKYALYRPQQKYDNQYDIWKTNHSANLYSPSLNNDYRFINTIHAIEMSSIYAHLLNSPDECQKILICVMLAYHIDSIQQKAKNLIKLPENFPSTDLLKALNEVQFEDLLPSNAKKLFTNVTSALVRHNSSKRDLFDWMKMFAVAHIFDQDYMFISHIKRHEHKEKYEIQSFYNLLKTNVKPYIDQINKVDL
ncbi:1410_t:CDS:2, partial [Gigaspora rosea]